VETTHAFSTTYGRKAGDFAIISQLPGSPTAALSISNCRIKRNRVALNDMCTATFLARAAAG
jgi:hypothetical protein